MIKITPEDWPTSAPYISINADVFRIKTIYIRNAKTIIMATTTPVVQDICIIAYCNGISGFGIFLYCFSEKLTGN